MNTSKTMGRPREFDMDEVLDAMVGVFWEKGYEGTSLSDILEATGLQKGSIYKAFQNKQEMFEKALERYLRLLHAETQAVVEKASSPLAGIEAMLKRVVEESCSKQSDFRGCLAVRSMADRTAHAERAIEILQAAVASAEKGLANLIEAAQSQGEIRCDLSAKSLAEALYCYISGMLATSRITTSKARTERLVSFALHMLQPAA
ncbi:MAG: TetR/AcrR family transcriptional regulator [Planctomycetota bacterium]